MSLIPVESVQESNPLLGQVLHGWEPWDDHIRYPVTFAVERETDHILALRITPLCLQALLPALSRVEGGYLALCSGGGELASCLPRGLDGISLCAASRLSQVGVPFELIHLGELTPAEIDLGKFPGSILLAPERALLKGSRYALSIEDACHGVLFTEDPELLRACLASFLEFFQVTLLGRAAELPPMPDALLDPLLEPTEPGVFREVRFHPGQRYWSMEFYTLLAGNRQPFGHTVRWVSEGERGRWRDGWRW